MADEDDRTTGAEAGGECPACRGGGTVQANVGEEKRTVPCPWCAGTGAWPGREHDAQEWGPALERG